MRVERDGVVGRRGVMKRVEERVGEPRAKGAEAVKAGTADRVGMMWMRELVVSVEENC